MNKKKISEPTTYLHNKVRLDLVLVQVLLGDVPFLLFIQRGAPYRQKLLQSPMAILPGLLRELLVLGDGPTEGPGNLGRALLLFHLGLEDLLVRCGRISQVVDDAVLRLAPPVNAPYDLPVDLWVPGDFKDDLDVSRLQVEPGSSTALVDEDDVPVHELRLDAYKAKHRLVNLK